MAKKKPSEGVELTPKTRLILQAACQISALFEEIMRQSDGASDEGMEPAVLIAIASRGCKLTGATISALSDDGDAPADFERTVLHG